MNFIELAKKRYSCRNYQDRKIDKEKLDIILEAGRIAPTAANNQPQRLIVVQESEGLKKLSECANIFNTPSAIIVCVDKEKAWTRPYDEKNTTDIDASIVTDHMMLAAADLGINSVWICYFNADLLRKEFNIPKNYEPINILILGYESGNGKLPDRHAKARLPISETVFYETF